MVKFIVNDITIDIQLDKTILEAKQEIIKQLNLLCPYIDIFYDIERPIRVMGKFNIEPGKVPRPFDKQKINAFAFKESIKVTIKEIVDYDPTIVKRPITRTKTKNINTMGPSLFDHNSNSLDMEANFDLDSETDFPSLGGNK